jgi:5-methylcytosine-specific restriction endonuclease McrA
MYSSLPRQEKRMIIRGHYSLEHILELAELGLGAYFLLESHLPEQNPHLNLYSEDHVLMTKDHIIPRSKGGKNHMSNYQTLCYECNQEKRDKL